LPINFHPSTKIERNKKAPANRPELFTFSNDNKLNKMNTLQIQDAQVIHFQYFATQPNSKYQI
jgi:hypothetical protein